MYGAYIHVYYDSNPTERAVARLNSVLETSSAACVSPAPTRYRCEVIARTALEVVSGIGGRLVDLVLAGWHVTAVLADSSDTRPLRVLGVMTVDLDSLLAGLGREGLPQVLTVANDIYRSNDRVQSEVHTALDQRIEVAVWNSGAGAEIDAELVPVLSATRHRLSVAARAFKARSLIAANRPPLFDPTESYWATAPSGADIHACI